MKQDNELRHPEGKIILTSGKELECYPKAVQPAVILPDEPGLDTTGVYLQVGKPGSRKKPAEAEEDKSWVETFLQNAFFLYAISILSYLIIRFRQQKFQLFPVYLGGIWNID